MSGEGRQERKHRPPRGRVLVVDDLTANRELLRQDLEDQGYEVGDVSSGPECIALVNADPSRYECVLLDIKMPGMDGIEVCRRLKSSTSTAHVPIVFVTGHRTEDALAIKSLEAGGNDFLTQPYSLPVLVARVSSQITVFRAQQRLREMVMRDEATGLFSRRFLFESLRQQVKLAARGPTQKLTCLMIDVDHFKRINDELGHLEGDRALRWIAELINRGRRGSDIAARFGGEEFAIILPSTDLEDAALVAERIRALVARESEKVVPVTVSVGVSTCQFEDGAEARDVDAIVKKLLRRADTALYRAKEQGRNRVCTE